MRILQRLALKSPTGNGTSSEPGGGLAVFRAKAISSFFSYFKTIGVGPALRIDPIESIAANCSTD